MDDVRDAVILLLNVKYRRKCLAHDQLAVEVAPRVPLVTDEDIWVPMRRIAAVFGRKDQHGQYDVKGFYCGDHFFYFMSWFTRQFVSGGAIFRTKTRVGVFFDGDPTMHLFDRNDTVRFVNLVRQTSDARVAAEALATFEIMSNWSMTGRGFDDF